MKNAVVAWMKTNSPMPIEVPLAQGKLTPGAIFTHHSHFFFSGLSKVADARRKGKPVKQATAYSKLDEWQSGGGIEFEFNDEHLTSNSLMARTGGPEAEIRPSVVAISGRHHQVRALCYREHREPSFTSAR